MSENITPFPPPAIEPPHPEGETMLLSQANAKRMAQELQLPALEVELERAIWQVETAIRKQNEETQKEGAQKQEVERQQSGEKDAAGTGVEIPHPQKDDNKTR
jgi:hypothetical protein